MAIVRTVGVVFLSVSLLGCGDDQDPEGARVFLEELRAESYQDWQRAPGYEERRESNTAHGDEVLIYINQVVADALAGDEALSSWPQGSVIAKDSFDGNEIELIAAMEKREDGWYWAEWDGDGDSIFSGNPETCTDCHSAGQDFVRAFPLPSGSN